MSDDVNIEIDENEMNLEELILLGEDKKIPIKIEFPQGEKRVTAKALIKQLTLKEASSIQTKNKSDLALDSGAFLIKSRMFNCMVSISDSKIRFKYSFSGRGRSFPAPRRSGRCSRC